MPYMIQQAFFHNMPLAFAMALKNFYVALNLELQGLLYWWAPDTQFALQKPYQLMFPPHSPSQYKQQIYKTMKEKTLLSNWMAKGFRDIAERPAVVASKLQLGDEDIKALLVAQVEAGNQDPWDTACNWLLQSDHLWQDWLPNETTCSMGKGLVDSSDNFTQRRGMAVKCAPCRPGHQSVEQDRTRVCIPCDAGHYQPLPGESTCLLCEPGTRSELKGQTECIPCSLGRFANRYAMTSCVQCGPADQTERWTTSEAVMSQREQTWIQIQGADSEDYCSCVEGTYLWKGRCEVCVEGSRCPGSNQLLLKPGYFSKPEAPGDVFRCYGRSRRCPGGAPGNCAAGRDSNSLSCTSCLPGLHETEDLCIACGSKDYVILVLVGLLCVFGIALLYVVLVKEGKTSRQPGSLLIAALGLGQMVTVVQQLTVIQQFKIVWGHPFSSILEFLELLAFDLDMVSIGCVAPLSPVLKFSIRTLLVLLFFVVACMVHCVYIAYKRAKTFRISLLLRTVGTLFMVFFISLCSSILAPFRCHIHPNGLWTVQSYDEVFCDGTQEHLQMALVGGFACLLPVNEMYNAPQPQSSEIFEAFLHNVVSELSRVPVVLGVHARKDSMSSFRDVRAIIKQCQEALAERNEEKNIAELLVVSDEKADSDRGRKKKISGHHYFNFSLLDETSEEFLWSKLRDYLSTAPLRLELQPLQMDHPKQLFRSKGRLTCPECHGPRYLEDSLEQLDAAETAGKVKRGRVSY